MKIAVFAYNFPHWKTQMGLLNMWKISVVPDIVLAADPVNLTFYQSQQRIAPKGLFLHNPADIAEKIGSKYIVINHSSDECVQIVKDMEIDIGIILGARILKKAIIDAFKIGVINMHPGLLPYNRGLDNIKWAVMCGIPQGVTVHFIDEKIDKGRIIWSGQIPIYNDDSLMDMYIRVQNLEQELLVKTLLSFEIFGIECLEIFPKFEYGRYFRGMPPDIEEQLPEYLSRYKMVFASE